jgi:hypothetical protein
MQSIVTGHIKRLQGEESERLPLVQHLWSLWINMTKLSSKMTLSRSPLDPEPSYHVSHQPRSRTQPLEFEVDGGCYAHRLPKRRWDWRNRKPLPSALTVCRSWCEPSAASGSARSRGIQCYPAGLPLSSSMILTPDGRNKITDTDRSLPCNTAFSLLKLLNCLRARSIICNRRT